MAARHGMGEVHQHARVALHRAADVAEQHQRPRAQRGAAPRQRHQLAAGAHAATRGRAADRGAGPRPGSQRRLRRQPGCHGSRARPRGPPRISARRELGEILVGERLTSLHDADRVVVAARAPAVVGLRLEQAGASRPRRRRPGRPSVAGGRVRGRRRRRRRRQKSSKARSKIGEVVAPVHEQRAAGVVDVVAGAGSRASAPDDVEHAAGGHVEPERAQQPHERRAAASAALASAARSYAAGRARRGGASSSASRSPRTASTSSRAFSTTPIVSSMPTRSSASRSSATSADTQSIVSDTPGAFSRSSVRSACTSAVTCAASRADASGTRPRTIASSFSKLGILDPLIQAAALQRVVHLARAVRGQDHQRRLRRRAWCRARESSPGTRPAAPAGSLRTPRRRGRFRR